MTAAARPFAGISEVAKTGGLLAAVVLHKLIYPIRTAGGVWPSCSISCARAGLSLAHGF